MISLPAALRRPSRPSPLIAALIACVLIAAAVGVYAFTRSAPASPGNTRAIVASQTRSPSASAATEGKTPATSAKSVLASARAAAFTAGWVHAQIKGDNGKTISVMSQDSGPRDGLQRIASGNQRVTVLVSATRTFVKANRSALAGTYGASPTNQRVLDGRWLRLLAGDPVYDRSTKGVTLASMLKEVNVTGHLTLLPVRSRHGRLVIGVRGSAGPALPADMVATLWVAADGSNLPVEYVAATADRTKSMTVKFSHWGEAHSFDEPQNFFVLKSRLASA